jgi:hypothetical protein
MKVFWAQELTLSQAIDATAAYREKLAGFSGGLCALALCHMIAPGRDKLDADQDRTYVKATCA